MDFVTQPLFSMLRRVILILLFFATPILCHAESVYVTDVLRVGVREVPDDSQPAHGMVVSGMKLEVLERKGGYIKIRSEKGVTGWIRYFYVTSDKPAKTELAELQAQQATLQATLQARLAAQAKLIKTETDKAASLEAELTQLKTSNRRLEARNSQVSNELSNGKAVGYLLYAIWIVMLLVFGFVAGFLWQRKQAMKQFGGL